MSSLAFAWRRLVRQPGRTALGVLGVAAVGALLFDMLLLSRGLVVSLENLLDRAGFDVRVMSTDAPALASPRIADASATVAVIAGLPEVGLVVPIRIGRARILWPDRAAGSSGVDRRVRQRLSFTFVGAAPAAHAGWDVVEGRDLHEVNAGGTPPILVNRNLAGELGVSPGGGLTLRGTCSQGHSSLPSIDFRVVGIATFPFDGESELTAAATLPDFARACGEEDLDEADVLLVASRPELGADAAARAIRRRLPGLYAFTNEELIDRFQQVGFTYFRQISTVLATITLFFGFLLVTMLLTVSVNQRFAEIAALRALGFPRRRIATDLLCESGVFVGAGGLLSLLLGAGLAVWLDAILRAMPGIPGNLHFFVFQPRALILHVALLALTAALAALYPVRLAAYLPIAATLRNEVIS